MPLFSASDTWEMIHACLGMSWTIVECRCEYVLFIIDINKFLWWVPSIERIAKKRNVRSTNRKRNLHSIGLLLSRVNVLSPDIIFCTRDVTETLYRTDWEFRIVGDRYMILSHTRYTTFMLPRHICAAYSLFLSAFKIRCLRDIIAADITFDTTMLSIKWICQCYIHLFI